MAVCPVCGLQQPDGVNYCDQCGAVMASVAPAAPQSPVKAQPDSTTAATTCSACGTQVMPGGAFCDHCGAALSTPSPSSPPLPQQARMLICSNCGVQLEADINFCDTCGTPVGTAPSLSVVRGRLVVQDTRAALSFPPGKTEIIIGREDAIGNIFPDVDLIDHGGNEGGVSRRHARIFVQGGQIFIEDLDSTNCTHVNQQTLIPKHPHPLNNGDEVRLGRVKLSFYTR